LIDEHWKLVLNSNFCVFVRSANRDSSCLVSVGLNRVLEECGYTTMGIFFFNIYAYTHPNNNIGGPKNVRSLATDDGPKTSS